MRDDVILQGQLTSAPRVRLFSKLDQTWQTGQHAIVRNVADILDRGNEEGWARHGGMKC